MAIKDYFNKLKFYEQKSATKETKELFKPAETNDVTKYYFNSFLKFTDTDEAIQSIGGRKALRKMLSDDEIYSAMDTRVCAVTATPWKIEGGNARVNKFIYNEIKKVSDDLFKSIWSALPYGYSITEIIYSQEGSQVGLASVIEKDFDSFIPQKDGSIYEKTSDFLDGKEVLREKYLLTVNEFKEIKPTGEALLEKLYWAWFFRCQGWDIWIRWMEKVATPFLVGKTENRLIDGKQSIDTFMAILDKAKRGSAIAIDKDSEIKNIETNSNGDHFKLFEDAVIARINRVVLGQTLATNTGNNGNYATAKVHNEVRQDKKVRDCKMIAKSVNRLITYLFELNNFQGEVPVFTMMDDRGLELERAGRDKLLVEQGVVFTRQYYIDNYDFDEKELEQFTNQPQQAQQSQTKPIGAFSGSMQFSSTQNQNELDQFVYELKNTGLTAVSEQKLKRLISEANSEEELNKVFSEIMDSKSDKFEETLTKALIYSRYMGFINNGKN